jgi:hypothetical protein
MNTTRNNRRIVGSVVFYAVLAISKERVPSVLLRTSFYCILFHIILLYLFYFIHIHNLNRRCVLIFCYLYIMSHLKINLYVEVYSFLGCDAVVSFTVFSVVWFCFLNP